MTFRLGQGARAEGHRLHLHDTLPSTNSEALRLAREGTAGPLWVVTKRQEAGRGRRGNAWVSPEGNLAASLLWPVPGVAPELVATLGFVAGVALVGALGDVTKSPDAFRLKWPNDVLAEGRKLAGILLEAEQLPGGRRAVVIGFGVNVAAAPEGLPSPAACLRDHGGGNAPLLFEFLSERFVEAARIWNKGRGFPEGIRRRWLERAAGLKQPVAVRTGSETLAGTFDDIDEGGRLVILAPDDGTRRTVTAGEVHFGEAATAA
ncbi:biotin--[acetyl-CoA-carboxylase] ligase [Methylobacterium organophilum]|uniref:biotin--[biotin carboxyl-carrier protein] ligase n=1 Tax=Methylobacterium organophilum TaxID=410 RepID=A0ABQ4TBN5_METOR|nr:biotin--[acetyl-CoA-carboxylase] ligase [Methylobacterium organophilum]UMY15697.1 biotin--[acetyl-CoA-carboxylase] ligase [Methylobacterium organophilum]GJE28280.1 Bifunctional ligase/repressor BirA [Methylobacterium organophilum]